MTEFITGLVLGALLTFFLMEYHKWKSCFIAGKTPQYKNTENIQWQNLMNYDGTVRGQSISED
ncbi:MAG: hypothetical protein IJD80_07550 [Oscillospiraceae bacterium]|nr:hypothetical protein [Oscillospiraceae bacterium]